MHRHMYSDTHYLLYGELAQGWTLKLTANAKKTNSMCMCICACLIFIVDLPSETWHMCEYTNKEKNRKNEILPLVIHFCHEYIETATISVTRAKNMDHKTCKKDMHMRTKQINSDGNKRCVYYYIYIILCTHGGRSIFVALQISRVTKRGDLRFLFLHFPDWF